MTHGAHQSSNPPAVLHCCTALCGCCTAWRSLFAPGQPIWSLATINKLYHDFVETPDTSSRTFEAKFKDQLAHSDPDTILLAGELLYIHLLPANGIKPETKRNQIRRVLNWASTPITTTIPQELNQALDIGIAKAGLAFLVGKPFQLGFLLDVMRHWKQLPIDQQSRALADPWEFKRFLFAIPIQLAYAQRELLLHIVHPDTFEAMMARDHKPQIVKSFAHLVDPNVTDVDQQLMQIRLKLEPTYGQAFHFYEERLKAQWQEQTNMTEQPNESDVPTPQDATGSTAAEIGLSGIDQIWIALQAIISNGGAATTQDIYEAVERAMKGNLLSQAGKASLRYFINTVAVNHGYVHPHDRQNPG
jgi:hypothetical protein